jgi:hypothetical protein
VTEAMVNGVLPTYLPFFYQQAVDTMSATYENQGEALAAIDGIVEFYRQDYRTLYAERSDEIYAAVAVLKDIYESSHFPEFEIYPDTYPDNVGHSEFPGCFRCHDGKHLSEEEESIRLHCNICHTVPQTVAEGEPPPEIPYREGWEPPNHLDSAWMADHRYIIDETCAGCHDMQTYCANPNCHGRSWPYVDLSVIDPPFPLPTPVPVGPTATPSPRPTVPPDATPAAVLPSFSTDILPLLDAKCGVSCHGAASALGGFDSTSYAGVSAAVIPGDPDASPFVQVQRSEHPAKLTAEELDLVIEWILAGAPEN